MADRALAAGLALLLAGCSATSSADIMADTFARLDSIRTERKTQVEKKLEAMMEKVRAAGTNPALAHAFARFRPGAGSGQPSGPMAAPEDRELDKTYLEEYYYFYDILFIDMSGQVFYTIRRESDLGKNLFTSELSSTLLAQKLKSGGKVEFVDYHFYSPSKEPAAFFIHPVEVDAKTTGWIAFQFSSAALKEIMSAETGLGKTAEVYLTNESKVMLTQSRLMAGNTILSQQVETEAVARAIVSGRGNGIILDYRSVRVFSSFEKFQFAGASWVIIAEVDEEEVITQRFMENREYYYEKIFRRLPAGPPVAPRPRLLFDENVKVDINEYGYARESEVVATAGVTTCTAVVIQYPGKFAYLGHAYPLDRVYYSAMERRLLDAYYYLADSVHGDKVVDLVGSMIRQISHFDIYPSETRRLEATLLAPHHKSFARITDKLLESGLFLSQIKILSLPSARYADVAVEVDSGMVTAHWVSADKSEVWTSAQDAPTLETLVKEIMEYRG